MNALTAPVAAIDLTREKVVMVHAMMLFAHIDGKPTSQKLAMVESYAKALPEFCGHNFQQYYQAAKGLASAADGSLDDAVARLAELRSEQARVRTYYMAVELALADGLTEAEDKLLSGYRDVLEIDSGLAESIEQIITLKFRDGEDQQA
ncbi:hypothetical protein GCM10027589_39690 [Actinocorallia lasiicapitis]